METEMLLSHGAASDISASGCLVPGIHAFYEAFVRSGYVETALSAANAQGYSREELLYAKEAKKIIQAVSGAFLRKNVSESEVAALGINNVSNADLHCMAELGYKLDISSAFRISEKGSAAYIEPCFIKRDQADNYLGLCFGERQISFSDMQGFENEIFSEDAENDNSIIIHPYYVRYSGSHRFWLDVVTLHDLGNAFVTIPVSVKAAHNWYEHALRDDKNAFIAAII